MNCWFSHGRNGHFSQRNEMEQNLKLFCLLFIILFRTFFVLLCSMLVIIAIFSFIIAQWCWSKHCPTIPNRISSKFCLSFLHLLFHYVLFIWSLTKFRPWLCWFDFKRAFKELFSKSPYRIHSSNHFSEGNFIYTIMFFS